MTVVEFPLWALDPRDADNRFRIYRRREGQLELIATTPDPQGVGLALCTLAEEDEFEDMPIGVLDTKGAPRGSGVWIVNPFARS